MHERCTQDSNQSCGYLVPRDVTHRVRSFTDSLTNIYNKNMNYASFRAIFQVEKPNLKGRM